MKPDKNILLQLLNLAVLEMGLFFIQQAKADSFANWHTNYVLNVMSGTPGAGWQVFETTQSPDLRGYSYTPYWDQPGVTNNKYAEDIGYWIQGRGFWLASSADVGGTPLERQGLRWWWVPYSQTLGQTQPGADSNFWFQSSSHSNLWVTLRCNEGGIHQNVVLYIPGQNPPPSYSGIGSAGGDDSLSCLWFRSPLELTNQYQYPFQFTFALNSCDYQDGCSTWCTTSSANYSTGGSPLDHYQHFVLFERPSWYLTGTADFRTSINKPTYTCQVSVHQYQSLVLASEDTGYGQNSDFNESVVSIESQDSVTLTDSFGMNQPVNSPKVWVTGSSTLTSVSGNWTQNMDILAMCQDNVRFFETEERIYNNTGADLNKLRLELWAAHPLHPGQADFKRSGSEDGLAFLDLVPEDQWLDTLRLSLAGNDLGSWRDPNAVWAARRDAQQDSVDIWFLNGLTWPTNYELDLHFGMENLWLSVTNFEFRILSTTAVPDQPNRAVSFDPPTRAGIPDIAHINYGATAYAVAVTNNRAYLAGTDGLHIYDLSNPSGPVEVGHTETGSGPTSVAITDHYAVLANYNKGLRIYDIADPTNLVYVEYTNDVGKGQCVTVSGKYAYLANDFDGLRIYDIWNPSTPVSIGHANDGGKAFGVKVSGHYAYLANYDDGFRIYDVSNPTNPVNVGHFNGGGAAWGVAVAGNYAYLANSTNGLCIYDISNPANPVSLGHVNDGGSASDVAVVGRLVYLANGEDGLRIYEVSNPANPVCLAHVKDGGFANGLALSDRYAYVANSADGLRVYWFSSGILSLEVIVTNGLPRISLSGLPGDVCRILASPNLVDWQTIATILNASGTVQFTDTDATNFSSRFYRMVIP